MLDSKLSDSLSSKKLGNRELDSVVGGTCTEEASNWYHQYRSVLESRMSSMCEYNRKISLGIMDHFVDGDTEYVFTLDDIKGCFEDIGIDCSDLI